LVLFWSLELGAWCLLPFARADGNTVIAWGNNCANQINPPPLTDLAAVSGGWYDSLALRSNGLVVAWGGNSFGQTNVPVVAWGNGFYGQTNLPAGLTNVVAIAAGNSHGLALGSDGSVTGWGDNTFGQTNVPAGLTNCIAIAAGGVHSLAINRDGTITAWGDNSAGQTSVPANLSQAFMVAAGFAHSLALAPGVTPIPPPLISEANSLADGTFQLGFAGVSTASYSVLASANLADWIVIGTASQIAPGQFSFTDSSATNFSARLYRVRAP
jgi:hypothetical protein